MDSLCLCWMRSLCFERAGYPVQTSLKLIPSWIRWLHWLLGWYPQLNKSAYGKRVWIQTPSTHASRAGKCAIDWRKSSYSLCVEENCICFACAREKLGLESGHLQKTYLNIILGKELKILPLCNNHLCTTCVHWSIIESDTKWPSQQWEMSVWQTLNLIKPWICIDTLDSTLGNSSWIPENAILVI
jgi:hypothetical protein